MKKLLSRLTRPASSPAQEHERERDTHFLSTQFDDERETRPTLPPPEVFVTWTERAAQVKAEAMEVSQGAGLFARVWERERHALKLSVDELDRLAANLSFARLPASCEVIGQDEQGDYMIMLLDGTVAVDRVQSWGGRTRLAEVRAGDMIGEMSVLDAGTRFSSCVTLTPCVVAVLDAPRLQRLVETEPRLALAWLSTLSRRLSLRLRQVSARLSALLSRS